MYVIPTKWADSSEMMMVWMSAGGGELEADCEVGEDWLVGGSVNLDP